MKKNIVTFLSIALVCTSLTSCSEKSSIKESSQLGTIPSLICQREKENEELGEKLQNASSESEASGYITKATELDTKIKAQIAEQKEKLTNKEITTEIDKGVSLKLTKPFTITDVSDNGMITARAEGVFTAPVKNILDFSNFNGYSIQVVFLNKEGTPIGADSGNCVYETPVSFDVPADTKVGIMLKISINKYNCEAMNEFDKILIVADSNNPLQKQGYEYAKTLKTAYKEKQKK